MRCVAVAVMLMACSGPRPNKTDPLEEPPPDPALKWMGTWTSPSCGTRPFERRIEFAAEGIVHGQERISPCPPNARCMWSGIVPWTGTWTPTSGGVTLQLTGELEPRATQKPPTSLQWILAPAEVSSSEACVYTRFNPGSTAPQPVELK